MSELFKDLYCCLTNDHVVKEPISLSCGHCICTQCVHDQVKIKCKICSIETDKSKIEINTESVLDKTIIKSSLPGLFEELEKRATNEIKSFKSLLENRESTLEAHLKFLEEEIQIRIESIKNNLDELFETFKKDLNGIKKEIIEIQNDALKGRTDTCDLENNLNELRDYIKNNEAKTEEKFNEHQENFKNINEMIKNFNDLFYSCKLDFEQSNDQVDKKLIGEILFEGLSAYKMNKMKKILMNARIESIQLPTTCGVSLIALPNGNVVYGTYRKVFLLNENNFQEIKRVSTGGDSFCALNSRNDICVSVHHEHCIRLFDLNLNQLKQFGSEGAENNQLNNPSGLCCHGDYVYICDRGNKRIQILNLDLEYSNTIQIDDYPRRVQTSETSIGVSCYTGLTFFFDLKTRALKHKHDNYETCNINYIDSTFYCLSYTNAVFQQRKFYFFDSDGNFIEEMAINENLIEHINRHTAGTMCKYKDQLYLIAFLSGKLIKFLE